MLCKNDEFQIAKRSQNRIFRNLSKFSTDNYLYFKDKFEEAKKNEQDQLFGYMFFTLSPKRLQIVDSILLRLSVYFFAAH